MPPFPGAVFVLCSLFCVGVFQFPRSPTHCPFNLCCCCNLPANAQLILAANVPHLLAKTFDRNNVERSPACCFVVCNLPQTCGESVVCNYHGSDWYKRSHLCISRLVFRLSQPSLRWVQNTLSAQYVNTLSDNLERFSEFTELAGADSPATCSDACVSPAFAAVCRLAGTQA